VSASKTSADVRRTLALVVICAAAVALVRGRLFEQSNGIREASDIYALPPPEHVVTMSLGYRSALADVMWANLLVTQGLRTVQRRRYENIIPIMDAINELDPTFGAPYHLADALITFNSKETPIEDARRARQIMERGVKNRPLDAELWASLGEFTAFIAPPSYLTDPAEQDEWRLAGARYLARAAELSGSNANIAWRAMGGARFLGRAGERDAEIRFLQRTLVITDDEELKEKIMSRLKHLLGKQREDEMGRHLERLERGVWDVRHHDLPFVTRLRYMVVGPPRDPGLCAGPDHEAEPACAPTWRDWEERLGPVEHAAP
jgi:hypothetical protein